MDTTTGEKRGATYNVEALAALPIEEILARLSVERKGMRWFCPGCRLAGRDARKPVNLAARSGRFHCFSCGAHGDTIELATLALGTDFKGACDYLSREFGVPMQDGTTRGPARRRRPRPATPTPRPEPRRETPAAVSEVFEDLLRRCKLTPEALAYCAGRGWTAELLRRYDVAAIADSARLFAELVEKHGLEGVKAAGLVTKGGHFMFAAGSWRHPILFPFYSRRSFRVEYIQARRLCPCDRAGAACNDAEGHGPKYLGAARPIPCLWNDLELANVPAGGRVHVTEGVSDALSLCGAGLVAVAVLGVQNLREDLLRELLPFDVVLCGNRDADANKAGQKFNAEAAARFARCGLRARVALPPEGFKDWNEVSNRRPEV